MDNGVGGGLYLKTPSGLFKVLEVIFALCAFICAMVAPFNWNNSAGGFFNITSLLALIYALVILIISVGNFSSSPQSGAKVDVIICFLLSILIFSSAALFTTIAEINDATTAAVVFQYLNGFAYLGNTLHKLLQ